MAGVGLAYQDVRTSPWIDRGGPMMIERDPSLRGDRQWLDWLSAHMWWASLLIGGILCVLALVLS